MLINVPNGQSRVYFVILELDFLCIFYYLTDESPVASLPLCNSSAFSLLPELHSVYSSLHIRPADLDGQSFHFRLRLLQRRPYRQVLQTICTTEGARAGGELSLSTFHWGLCRGVKFKFALPYTAEKCV